MVTLSFTGGTRPAPRTGGTDHKGRPRRSLPRPYDTGLSRFMRAITMPNGW